MCLQVIVNNKFLGGGNDMEHTEIGERIDTSGFVKKLNSDDVIHVHELSGDECESIDGLVDIGLASKESSFSITDARM